MIRDPLITRFGGIIDRKRRLVHFPIGVTRRGASVSISIPTSSILYSVQGRARAAETLLRWEARLFPKSDEGQRRWHDIVEEHGF